MSFHYNFSKTTMKNISLKIDSENSSFLSSPIGGVFSFNDLFETGFGFNLTRRLSACDFPPQQLPSRLMAFLVTAYLLIIVTALLDNLLVVVVVAADRKMRTVTNVLLVSLAVSDMLIAGLNMPFQLKFLIQNDWTMGEALCRFTSYIQGVVVVTSIFTLTGIAIDRYYAICRPLQARHVHTIGRALLLTTCFWLTATVILIPQLIVQRLEPLLIIDEQRISTVQTCVEFIPDHRLNIAYTVFFYVILYVFPVAVMFVAYGRIGVTLWYRSPLIEATPAVRADANRRTAEKKRVVRMLIVIVALFSVSWFPFFAAQVYLLFDGGECHRHFSHRAAVAGLQLFAYSNCCLNPVVYCLLNDSFKQSLRRALAKALAKRRLRRPTWSGRRGTLTDTMRTTAGLLSTSNRRGSYPNGGLTRQLSSPQRLEPLEENVCERKPLAAHRDQTGVAAKGYNEGRCYGDESSRPQAMALKRCQIDDAQPDKLLMDEANSAEKSNQLVLKEEADAAQEMDAEFQSPTPLLKSIPSNHNIDGMFSSGNEQIFDGKPSVVVKSAEESSTSSREFLNLERMSSMDFEDQQDVPNVFRNSVRDETAGIQPVSRTKRDDSCAVDNEENYLVKNEENYDAIQLEFQNLDLLLEQLLMGSAG